MCKPSLTRSIVLSDSNRDPVSFAIVSLSLSLAFKPRLRWLVHRTLKNAISLNCGWDCGRGCGGPDWVWETCLAFDAYGGCWDRRGVRTAGMVEWEVKAYAWRWCGILKWYLLLSWVVFGCMEGRYWLRLVIRPRICLERLFHREQIFTVMITAPIKHSNILIFNPHFHLYNGHLASAFSVKTSFLLPSLDSIRYPLQLVPIARPNIP